MSDYDRIVFLANRFTPHWQWGPIIRQLLLDYAERGGKAPDPKGGGA
jgi:hypothetical protein